MIVIFYDLFFDLEHAFTWIISIYIGHRLGVAVAPFSRLPVYYAYVVA